jgi:hypothetical protein
MEADARDAVARERGQPQHPAIEEGADGQELADPFYFSCNKISSYFKASSAPTHTAV